MMLPKDIVTSEKKIHLSLEPLEEEEEWEACQCWQKRQDGGGNLLNVALGSQKAMVVVASVLISKRDSGTQQE